MTKKVILVCSECLSRNYNYKKNKYDQNRLCLNKYCKKCNRPTIHKESR